MNILVTGGCGYIGTLLTQALLAQGHCVTVYDAMWFGNYLDSASALRIVQGDIRETDRVPMEGIEVIFHLANVANDPCSDLDSKMNWEINTLATMQLVEKAIDHGVKQFTFASSGSVYGVKEEEQVTEALSLLPISDYNKTKMISERVLLSYADQIIVQSIRPATVCGYSPRMRLDLSVNLLTMQAVTNGRITVFGGNQTRPNIHVQDMVRVYLHFLERGNRLQGIFNAGFENISILDIAKRVTQFVPAEISISESNDPRSYRLNSDKLLATGFEPKFGIDNAIREVVDAVRSGHLKDEDCFYNIKTMMKMEAFG